MKLSKTEMKLTLPTELSKPSNVLWDFGIMIHADKKVGKTSLTSMIPDTFFMMTQPGAKAFRLFQKPVQSWEEFKGYIKLLERDKRFKRVVVDHIDEAYKFCVQFVCEREGWDHPEEGGSYGVGWSVVNKEFSHWITRLLACNKGVILLTHSVLKDIKTRGGAEYSRVMTTLSGGAWGILEQNVDVLIHLYYEGDKRMMQILGDEHVSAGHNLEGHFRYTDGSPIKTIPMGKNKEEAYQNLINAFENKLVRPKEDLKNEVKPKKSFKLKK